jgi:hypothetical protein
LTPKEHGCPKCGSWFEYAVDVSEDIKEIYCGEFLALEIKEDATHTRAPTAQRCES